MSVGLNDGIELLSGTFMDYANPENCNATIEDIAHALSNVCRFSGHLPRHYSVAQHCVNVSYVIEAAGGNVQQMFEGLMHDTAEAFTNDLPTPLKTWFPEFKVLEQKIEAAMGKRFGFGYPYCNLVKDADLILLGLEKDHVKKNSSDWVCLEGCDYNKWRKVVNLSRMTPTSAYELFMERYHELVAEKQRSDI